MSDFGGYINMSHSNSFYFTNACNNDMLIYPQTSNQTIHLGITSNAASIIAINMSNISISAPTLDIASTINIRSNVTILGQLTVCNVEYITSNITIYGSEIIQSNLSVVNIATLCNNVNSYGAATISNTMNITALSSLCNVNISGAVALSNGLNVYNNGITILSNAVNIYGTTTVSNNMQLTGNLGIGSNIITAGSSNRIWDFSGTIADGYGKPGYVSKSYITGSNITVSTLTPFSNLNTEGSIYFQGITGNYITVVPKPVSAALPDTTIETWIYQTANPVNANANAPYLIGNMITDTGSTNQWSFGINSTNQLSFYTYNGANSSIIASTTITNNTWNHIAFSYSNASKIIYMFINGVLQTLTATGAITGSGTTAITFTTGISSISSLPIVIGQYNNVALGNTYISNFRYTNAALYTSSFTPSTYPLQTYSNSTQLLLRAPLYNTITNINSVHSHDSMRAHCLPTDAMIYADCYGTNQPNLSGAFVPTFDSNITKSIVFSRTNSNYLSFPPQTFNIATKGFTLITKAMLTGTPLDWEWIFFSGNTATTGDNLIWLARTGTTPQLTFGLSSNNATASLNNSMPPNISINQATIFTCISRYDPFTNGGTTTIWYNSSNIYSSNAMSSGIGTDRTINNLYIGRNIGAYPYLNGNIHNFALYNRALTDKEIIDASAALMVEPSLPNKSTVEIGNASGKPALTVQQDGTIQIAGPITTNNNLSYSPVDYGVSNFSIPGSIVGTVPVVAMTPFNTTTEGSLYAIGANYVSVQNTIFTTSWWLNGGFTCECWVNYPTFANVANSAIQPYTIGNMYTSGGIYWSFGASVSGQLTYFYYNNISTGVNNVQGYTIMQPNKWYHIAVTCDATNIRIFLNGNLENTAAIAGTPLMNLSGVYNPYLSIAQCGGSTIPNGIYMTNARLVYGSALYTANFTSPTGPLGPAATGTTALLLRAPQNPGRVLIPKIGGTTQVRAYPPAGLTGYLTNIQNVSYGAGNYIATASTEKAQQYWPSWKGFYNSDVGGFWNSADTYSTGIGVYIGSISTIDINGAVYTGEWLQIQLPINITLSSYSITPQYGPNNTPKIIYILGSTDGIKWQSINYQSNILWPNANDQNFTVNTSSAFNYYRIVTNSTTPVLNQTTVSIGCVRLYGTEESISITPDGQVGLGVSRSVQALEVAGNSMIYGNVSGGNIGMFRNKVINGDMRISQRGTTFSIAASTTTSLYTLDRFTSGLYGGAGTINTIQNTLISSDTPFQFGFRNSLKATANNVTAYNDTSCVYQCIENFNVMDLNWGTSYGQPITISLWFKAAISGNYSIAIRNGGAGSWWGYSSLFTYNLAGIWQYVTTTIPPPPANSTWNMSSYATSTYGIQIFIGGNSSSYSYAPNLWSATPNESATGATIWMTTTGNYIELTGVQLEKGTIATPFESRPYAMELQLCQRYYYQLNASNTQLLTTTFQSGTAQSDSYIPTRVSMRTAPSTLTTSAMSTFNIGAASALTSMAISVSSDSTPDLIRLTQYGTFSNNIYAAGVYMRASSNQTAFLGFSAEI